LSATVFPSTATRAAVFTSASVKKSPEATCHPRISGNLSLTPTMPPDADQFWLPNINWPPARTLGLAARTDGNSFPIASTSSTVSVAPEPEPPRMPPEFDEPAET
jgi:hypothetical protein